MIKLSLNINFGIRTNSERRERFKEKEYFPHVSSDVFHDIVPLIKQ